jgi:acyl-CoA synthetase (AMP-forming)/AMP-acid ligase II
MKVYPGDIDAVIERFEEVLDVCTFAYEDPLLGENVGTAVVLKSRDDRTLKRLFDWTKLHLAQHQLPSRWYLLDEIPRTSRGKINRDGIAATCKGIKPLDLRSSSGVVENSQGAQVNDH